LPVRATLGERGLGLGGSSNNTTDEDFVTL